MLEPKYPRGNILQPIFREYLTTTHHKHTHTCPTLHRGMLTNRPQQPEVAPLSGGFGFPTAAAGAILNKEEVPPIGVKKIDG